ncbi:MAG: GTP 3',8-cyclase MoaA [Dehalococcoidia bacterium]|nr:GTP 3',8-cyclase MoaA [Dehalococcoidia bacterium]
MTDSFNRPINYLRISVTDRCNLRCQYCMPSEGIVPIAQDKLLRYEEIVSIVRAASRLGISKIRLTGGEPLVRAGFVDFVAMLGEIEGIDDIALTTNGTLLGKYASDLRKAGLRRVNVSLDTLRADRFEQIARRPGLTDVLKGIDAANDAGLTPVKVNVVVMRGVNDDELLDFARLTMDKDWHVRFIEVMPMGEEEGVEYGPETFISVADMLPLLSPLGELNPCKIEAGNGPAKYYSLPGAKGTIGFISPVSEHFCFDCNRLRLTADGHLRPCLMDINEVDLKSPMRAGISDEGLEDLVKQAILKKPERHLLHQSLRPGGRAMVQIGG